MDQPIRLALFGVGRWGSHLLRNFLALPEVAVVAIVELNQVRHPEIRKRFSLPPEIALTAEPDAVLARSDIDAVAIATPAATHFSLIKTALETGKHVLAEKPLTLQVAQAEALCRLAAEQRRQLVIDHTYLFHPAVQAAQSVIANDSLGPLRYGYATRTNLGPVRPDVDALWDLAIHDIAIFNDWLGEMPVAVAAQGHCWLQAKGTGGDFPGGLADVCWLRLTYPSGFQATVHVSWANPDKQRRLGIVGDRGTLIFDEMQPTEPLVLQRGHFEPAGMSFTPSGQAREALAVPSAEPLKQLCRHFIQCIWENRPSERSDGRVGTELVKVLVAASASMHKDGMPVAIA